MASAPRHLRIFLASPGDVVDEREIALAVLEDLSYDPLLRNRVTIEAVAWDKRGAGAPILAGVTPQDSIAAGLPRPSDCDIVVVIFWSRMGTPLPSHYQKEDRTHYESGTEWEYDDAVSAFLEHQSPYVLLYRRKQPVLLDLDAPDREDRNKQYEKVKRFFARLQNADGSAAGGYTEYAFGEFRKRLELDLKSLIAQILEKPARHAAIAAVPPPWPGSPFPGLRAFTAVDAPIFFGREREIDTLLARIADYPFVAVVGASGSGKSSLVGAGMIPRLQLTAGSSGIPPWMILQFTPDRLGTGDPFVSLAAAILHAIPETQQKALATRLREESDLLGRLLPRRTLIFIDQFEELFTTIQPSLRVPFVAMLKQLVLAAEMRVVITVRADFYANCVEMETLAHIIEHTTFPLSAPGVAALYDMITRPAARAALTFEEGLAQRILDDTGQAPGALALMAYTLDELYRRGLSHAAYEELGGVQGAIGKRSETMFLFLGEEEKAALPSVFRELVEVDERGTATRQRAPLARVASTPAARRLTDALTDARLLVQSRSENNEPVVEVAHEALFRTWLRLAEWIRDAADDLRLLRQVRTAAIEWDRNGRRVDFLWSHERLAPAYALRDRMGIEFDDITSEFIRPEYERLAEQFRTDQREFRQRSCVERLIEIGPPAAGALVGSLQHASTEATRRDIVTALGVLGQAAVPHLIDACLAERFKNRDAVLDALVRMRTSPGTAALEHLLEDKDVHIRVDAIRLAAITAHQDAIPSLARRFNDYVSDVRILAMLAVATFDSHQALATLESTLTRDASWSGLAVIEQLVFRDQAESDLLSTLEPPMRQVAESLLALISTNDMRHAEAFAGAIIPMLDDVEHPLFKTALRILIGSGSPTALRAVLNTTREHCSSYVLRTMRRSVRSRMMPALMDLLDAPESHVRASAARMLRQLATSGDLQFQDALHQYDGVSRLLRLTNDKDAEVSLSALTVLAAVRSIEAREVFRQYLSSPVDRIRRVAIQGLGRLGHLSAVPDLIAGLHDSFNGARIAAAIALVKLGAEKRAASEALAILARIADSAHDSDFKSVLIHIASAAPSPTFEEVLRRVQKSPSGAAVRVAARKLKSSGH